MYATRRTYTASLLALVTLGAACSADAPPTAPTAIRPTAALAAAAAKPRPRTPYIADLQLSSISIPTSPSDEITPFTVKVTNPTSKDVLGISLEGVLEPTFNNQPPPATAFVATCPNPTGVLPRGDCVMSNWISSGSWIYPGPGTFTLRLLQLQSDGTKKVLDTKVVAVVFE